MVVLWKLQTTHKPSLVRLVTGERVQPRIQVEVGPTTPCAALYIQPVNQMTQYLTTKFQLRFDIFPLYFSTDFIAFTLLTIVVLRRSRIAAQVLSFSRFFLTVSFDRRARSHGNRIVACRFAPTDVGSVGADVCCHFVMCRLQQPRWQVSRRKYDVQCTMYRFMHVQFAMHNV